MTTTRPMFPPSADSLRAFGAGLAMQERLRENALHDLARLRKEARAEIDRLIQFLDQSDTYVVTELEEDDEREDGGDAEPSLGSFDRMTNEENSYRQVSTWCLPGGNDLEQDDCDREDSDPAEESEVSGIGDREGLLEQIGPQSWQLDGYL